jgi:hypothetical protein
MASLASFATRAADSLSGEPRQSSRSGRSRTLPSFAWYGLSGIPRTREAAWNPSSNYPIQYLGRGSGGNMPFLSQLDLYVQHEIKIGDGKRLVLSANVINLLNQDTATNYFATQLESGAIVDVAETTILYQGSNFQQLRQHDRVAFLRGVACDSLATPFPSCVVARAVWLGPRIRQTFLTDGLRGSSCDHYGRFWPRSSSSRRLEKAFSLAAAPVRAASASWS